MAKNTKGNVTPDEQKKRLQEIAETSFGALSDDDILHLLAERTHLAELQREYEQAQAAQKLKEEQERKKAEAKKILEKKKVALAEKIKELNKSISPDKQDDDLLALIAHRKELEQELDTLGGAPVPHEDRSKDVPVEEVEEVAFVPETVPEITPEPLVVEPEKEITVEEKKETVPETPVPIKETVLEENFGSETIVSDGIEEGSEYKRYLDQLRSNLGSLGELLQKMPLDAKKNKAFMLKVAAIDPAYAMHYADKDTLKRDEDFNIRIASLGNPRNSGNALAEMLPEARTSKVVLAAVKQDYRNIRFIQPTMADYDAMLEIAKKRCLEKIHELKEAADAMVLVPKVLQQDKQFMAQVNEIIATQKKE